MARKTNRVILVARTRARFGTVPATGSRIVVMKDDQFAKVEKRKDTIRRLTDEGEAKSYGLDYAVDFIEYMRKNHATLVGKFDKTRPADEDAEG